MTRGRKDTDQAARLRTARTARGFKTASAAISNFRWKTSTYLAHENGQNGIGPDAAVAYGAAFGVDPGWLVTGHGKGIAEDGREYVSDAPTRHHRSAKGTDGPINIPIYDIRSFETLNEGGDRPLDYFSISQTMLGAITDAQPSEIVGLIVKGDSMIPTLQDRDIVFVDRRRQAIRKEGLYVLNFAGEALVKRAHIHLDTGFVTLSSDNPRVPPQTITKTEKLQIFGQIFWSMSRH